LHGQSIVVYDRAANAYVVQREETYGEGKPEVTTIGASPNGRNINDAVGALHPPSEISVDLAICLDGDGDRVTLVDSLRGLLDGDDLLYFLAEEGPVVGTVMTNGGLERALGPGRLGVVEVQSPGRHARPDAGGGRGRVTVLAGSRPDRRDVRALHRAAHLAVPWGDKNERLPRATRNARRKSARPKIARAEQQATACSCGSRGPSRSCAA
jgi:hypothetical protein